MSSVDPPVTVAVNGAFPPTHTSVEEGEAVTAASGCTITVTAFDASIAGHPELGSSTKIRYCVVPAAALGTL